VVYSSNVNSVVTRNPYGDSGTRLPTGFMGPFLQDVVSGYSAMSFVLTATYVGAAGTVQVIGNRSEEGKFDALFSFVAGPALSPSEDSVAFTRHAVMVIANIGTHSSAVGEEPVPPPPYMVDEVNLAVHYDSTSPDYDVTSSMLGLVRMVTITNE